MALGKRLRALRESQELTQEDVEAATRISQPYLSKIERDRELPAPETFTLIAETLGMENAALAEMLTELRFQRDRAELEKLGFHAGVARVAAALERLDEEQRTEILSRALAEISAHFPAAAPEEAKRVAPADA